MPSDKKHKKKHKKNSHSEKEDEASPAREAAQVEEEVGDKEFGPPVPKTAEEERME